MMSRFNYFGMFGGMSPTGAAVLKNPQVFSARNISRLVEELASENFKSRG
jgi:hypothetical protein